VDAAAGVAESEVALTCVDEALVELVSVEPRDVVHGYGLGVGRNLAIEVGGHGFEPLDELASARGDGERVGGELLIVDVEELDIGSWGVGELLEENVALRDDAVVGHEVVHIGLVAL